MYRLVISKNSQNKYNRVDHNDERLELLSYLIIDEQIRTKLKERLNHFEGFIINQPYDFTTFDNKKLSIKQIEVAKNVLEDAMEELEPTDNGLLIVLLIDEEFGRLNLQTDITKNKLLRLIEEFEDLVDMDAKEIELTRVQDSFKLKKLA